MKKALTVLALLLSSNLYAGVEDDKLAAAHRYLAAAPMSAMVDDMTSKVALQVPEKERAKFVRLMTKELDVEALEAAVVDALVKTFTLEELNAFADFYGSEVGKSAIKKFGTYMSLVMPVMQQEMKRAIKKIEAEK